MPALNVTKCKLLFLNIEFSSTDDAHLYVPLKSHLIIVNVVMDAIEMIFLRKIFLYF